MKRLYLLVSLFPSLMFRQMVYGAVNPDRRVEESFVTFRSVTEATLLSDFDTGVNEPDVKCYSEDSLEDANGINDAQPVSGRRSKALVGVALFAVLLAFVIYKTPITKPAKIDKLKRQDLKFDLQKFDNKLKDLNFDLQTKFDNFNKVLEENFKLYDDKLQELNIKLEQELLRLQLEELPGVKELESGFREFQKQCRVYNCRKNELKHKFLALNEEKKELRPKKFVLEKLEFKLQQEKNLQEKNMSEFFRLLELDLRLQELLKEFNNVNEIICNVENDVRLLLTV